MLQNRYESIYKLENSYEKFIQRHLQHYGYYAADKCLDINHHSRKLQNTNEEEEDQTEPDCDKQKNIDESILSRTTQLILDELSNGQIIYKLRDPLQHDFSINFDQPPRWPIEMQTLPEKIIHIRNKATDIREPLYNRTGYETKPMSNGEDNGNRLVYEYYTFSSPFFIRSKIQSFNSNVKVPCATISLESPTDVTLLFESRFESGNLEKAYQISTYEYELHLRTDLYTNKHTQWYYFRISNTRANQTYRFTIVNLYKSQSLYNEGLKPLMYSDLEANKSNKGWRRCGSNIIYYRNNRKYQTCKGIDRSFYSLTWTVTLAHDNDTVYFSHCYPYTYSDMMGYINDISCNPRLNKICHIKLLAKTLADNICPLLTITNPLIDVELEKKKKVIIITARVHPGESNASWMMEGVLDFLLSTKSDAQLLRDLFIFKVVPMLNPDGVIVGNYRCSLAGRDLNRNYKSMLKSSYPVIYRLKAMIQKLALEKEVLIYCDLHGHSRKQNIFMYGNNDHRDERTFLLERAFPFLLSKNAKDKFSYQDCAFKMQKNKEGTSRIVFRRMGILHSCTIEASFCGSNLQPKSDNSNSHSKHSSTNKIYFHFNIHDLKQIGEAFGSSLLDYFDPDSTQLDSIISSIKTTLTNRYFTRLEEQGVVLDSVKKQNINLTELDESDIEPSDNEDYGSDSSDSNGLPADLEFVQKQINLTKNTKPKAIKQTSETGLTKEQNRQTTCLKIENSNKSQINLKSKFLTPLLSTTSSSTRNDKSSLLRHSIERNSETPSQIRRGRTFHKREDTQIPLEITKTVMQEVETKKILLKYSTSKPSITSNENDIETTQSKVIQQNDDKIKGNSQDKSIQWRLNAPTDEITSKQNLFYAKSQKRPDSGLSINTFQVFSFSPQTDLDPRQKSFNSLYNVHTTLNKRVKSNMLVNNKQAHRNKRKSISVTSTNGYLTFNSLK